MAKKTKDEIMKLLEKVNDNTISSEEKLIMLNSLNSTMKKADELLGNVIVAMQKEISK